MDCQKVIEDSRIPILPYTRYKGKKDTFKPWDFTYNVVNDSFVCPGGHELRHTTTSKDGNELTAVPPRSAKIVPAEAFVVQMKTDSGCSQPISGRNFST